MAINLEMPKKLQAVIEKGHQGAAEMLRPISRKYDLAEHAYPVELDTLAGPVRGHLGGQYHLASRAPRRSATAMTDPRETSTAATCPRC